MSRISCEVCFHTFEGLVGYGFKWNKKENDVSVKWKGLLEFAINFLNDILAEYAINILHHFERKMVKKITKKRWGRY